MKILPELEQKFIEAYLKQNKTDRDHLHMQERNRYINNHFEITTQIVEKLVALNKKLSILEKRFFKFYRFQENNAKLMVANKEIEDYNICVELSYWNTHFDEYHDDMEGNPVYSTCNTFMIFQDAEHYIDEDYTECINVQLPVINHCYSFHDLYDHSGLTLFDISNMEDVWMEVKIDYQMMLQF